MSLIPFFPRDQSLIIATVIETNNARKARRIPNLSRAKRNPKTMISFLSNANAKRIAADTAVPRPNAIKSPIMNAQLPYNYFKPAECNWRGLACVGKSLVPNRADCAGQLATTDGGGLVASNPRNSSRRLRRFK